MPVESQLALLTPPEISIAYTGAVVFHGFLSILLFSLVGLAYKRNGSIPYFFVWVATSTLVIDSLIGALGLVLTISPVIHILFDHGLDILLVLAILAAIHSARQVEQANPTHDRI